MSTYGTIPTSSSGIITTNLEYLSRAKYRIKTGLGTRRPWKEMFNITSLNFPHTIISEALPRPRIKTNTSYFLMNYTIIMLFVLFLGLLWHPISLIMFVVVMCGWLFSYFLRDEPLVVFQRVVDDRVVMIVLSFVTVGLLLLTGVMVNVFAAIFVGFLVVFVHGAVRKTDDLCLDEDGFEAGDYLVGASSS